MCKWGLEVVLPALVQGLWGGQESEAARNKTKDKMQSIRQSKLPSYNGCKLYGVECHFRCLRSPGHGLSNLWSIL